jgi:hypothetical protein
MVRFTLKTECKTVAALPRFLWVIVNSAVASFSEHSSWWDYRLNCSWYELVPVLNRPPVTLITRHTAHEGDSKLATTSISVSVRCLSSYSLGAVPAIYKRLPMPRTKLRAFRNTFFCFFIPLYLSMAST